MQYKLDSGILISFISDIRPISAECLAIQPPETTEGYDPFVKLHGFIMTMAGFAVTFLQEHFDQTNIYYMSGGGQGNGPKPPTKKEGSQDRARREKNIGRNNNGKPKPPKTPKKQ